MPTRLIPAALLSLALAALVQGDEPRPAVPSKAPPPRESARARALAPAIDKLIEQLGDSDFRKRDDAERQLRAQGVAVVPALRKALGHRDPEVRRRALALIPALERAAVLTPRRVNLKIVNKPLRVAFDEITKQTGFKISYWSSESSRLFNFDLENVTFWEAIDHICKEAGLVVQTGYGDDQLRIQEQKGHAPYVTHSGAFRFVPTGFQLNRNITFGVVGKEASGGARSEHLTLQFTLFVEPRMPLMNLGEVKLTAAYDTEKNSMLMPAGPEAGGYNPWMGRRYYRGYSGNRSHSMQTQVNLHRVSEKATGLKYLRGTVPVTLLVEQKPVVVTDDFLKSKGKKVKIGTTQFIFEDIKPIPANKQYQLRLTISEEQKDSNMHDWSWMNSLYQRIELQDVKGNKYQVYSTSWGNSSPTNVQLTLTYGQSGAKLGPPQKFIFHAWKTMEHQVEFELRDLPLP